MDTLVKSSEPSWSNHLSMTRSTSQGQDFNTWAFGRYIRSKALYSRWFCCILCLPLNGNLLESGTMACLFLIPSSQHKDWHMDAWGCMISTHTNSILIITPIPVECPCWSLPCSLSISWLSYICSHTNAPHMCSYSDVRHVCMYV